MNLFLALTQAVSFVDARAVLSCTSLMGSIGAAGVAVTVTRSFVGLLRHKAEGQRQFIEEIKRSHAESQKTFQDQLDRLSDRNQACQYEFQSYIARTSDAQNMIVRDVIVAMKTIETANGGSTVTTQGTQIDHFS